MKALDTYITQEGLEKLKNAAEKCERGYESFSDTELDEMMQELRNKLSALEEEKLIRARKDKEKAWNAVVESIENFCTKYGAIQVSGEYNLEGVFIDIETDRMDGSTIGLIEM